MGDLIIETGGEVELRDLLTKFDRRDVTTVMHCWSNAKRRNHLMILHAAAAGYTVASIVPPDKFTFEDHKIAQKYQQYWMGQHIKPKHMYVFGTEAAFSALTMVPQDLPNPFEMEEIENGRTEHNTEDVGSLDRAPESKPRKKTSKSRRKSPRNRT